MDIFHVVIETSVLTQNNFKTGRFDRLLRRVQQGVIKLYIPEIVLEERRTQLLYEYNKYAEEARTALTKMGRSPLNMLLEGMPLPEAVDLPTRDEVDQNSRAVFRKYLADNHIELIPFSHDHAVRALERYLHGQPPFRPSESREPERKHIPDAWILEAALEVKLRAGRHCMLVKDERFSAALADLGFEVFKEVDTLDAMVEAATAVVTVDGKAIAEVPDAADAAAGGESTSPMEKLRAAAFKDMDVIVMGMNEALGNPERERLFATLEDLGMDRRKAELMAETLEASGVLVVKGNRLLPSDNKLASAMAEHPLVHQLLMRMI